MSLLDHFPHKCTIRRKKYTKDSLGGAKLSYTVEQTNVLCWEQPAGDSEDTSYQKRGMSITHKVYFLTNPNVSRRHEILITYRNGATVANPVVLEAMSIALPDSTAGLDVCYRVLCSEVTSEED